MFFEPQVFQSF